jgi:hypothetical protein
MAHDGHIKESPFMVINIIASSLGFIGTLLLAFFGLPTSDLMADGTRIIQADANDESKRKARNMRIASKTGMGSFVWRSFCS